MPKLRRFGAMEMPAADENTTFPCKLISPDLGTSRPAMERSVVVLPQPLGPSSVKSLPSGTSNETSWVTLTAWRRSPGYSVHSDLTISTTWSVSRSHNLALSSRRVARVERNRNPGPPYPRGNTAPGLRSAQPGLPSLHGPHTPGLAMPNLRTANLSLMSRHINAAF